MLDRDAIRSLIRDVIADEVRQLKPRGGEPPRVQKPDASTAVTIARDADLAAFARQVLELAKDPGVRAAIEGGRHPFRLAERAGQNAAAAPAARAHRIDKGVVTEAAIAKLPAGTASLQLGPGVTVTPLARDRARSAGISIERTGQ